MNGAGNDDLLPFIYSYTYDNTMTVTFHSHDVVVCVAVYEWQSVVISPSPFIVIDL